MEKNYADDANKILKKSIEGDKDNVNYYSGDRVQDLVPDEVPQVEEGVNINSSAGKILIGFPYAMCLSAFTKGVGLFVFPEGDKEREILVWGDSLVRGRG